MEEPQHVREHGLSAGQVSPWSGIGLVVGAAVAFFPIAGASLFWAAFCGRSGWAYYLAAGVIWCGPLLVISLLRIGRWSRVLAVTLAILGGGYLLVGLQSFLNDPGWQF